MKTVLLLLLALAVSLTARETPSPTASVLSPAARQCFTWYATLGYPDVREAPWIKIWTGVDAPSEDSPVADCRLGFLLGERDGRFETLETDLARRTWVSRLHPTEPRHRVTYERQDFNDYTRTLLDELRHPPAKSDSWPRMGPQLGRKSETFVIAYVAWQRGDTAMAQALFDGAAKLPRLNGRVEEKTTPEAIRPDLEKELGYTEMWRAVLRCNHHSLPPRAELRAAFQDIADHYPHSGFADRARRFVSTFDRMIQQDATHATFTDDQLAALPPEAQVREYIFRLRDQHGAQWTYPGSCDLFTSHRRAELDSTALRLVKLGHVAVPQLIEALSDDSLARAVGCHRDFYFSHHVLTVGDCAEIILSRIAGRKFFERHSTSSYMSMENEVEATRKKAVAWWNTASHAVRKPSRQK